MSEYLVIHGLHLVEAEHDVQVSVGGEGEALAARGQTAGQSMSAGPGLGLQRRGAQLLEEPVHQPADLFAESRLRQRPATKNKVRNRETSLF